MLLAGIAAISILFITEPNNLVYSLCLSLGITLLTLQWPVFHKKMQALGAGVLVACSSAVIMTIIAIDPHSATVSAYYYMPVIIAASVLLQGKLLGALVMLVFTGFNIAIISGHIESLSYPDKPMAVFTDRFITMALIYGITAYTDHTIELAFKQINKADKKIRLQDKLAALGVFSGGIAHEINNPLAVIKGFISQINRWMVKENVDPSIQLKLDRLNSNVQRITDVTHSLLTLGHDNPVNSDSLQNFSPQQITADAINILKSKIDHYNITIVNEVDVTQSAKGSPNHLRIMLRVIIDNAIDALGASQNSNRKVTITSYDTKKNFCLDIVDNGPGIPDKIMESIFDPFFTTKDTGKGSGVGLALVAKLCSSLRWSIQCESKIGSTKFTLKIPKKVPLQIAS